MPTGVPTVVAQLGLPFAPLMSQFPVAAPVHVIVAATIRSS